MRRLALAALMVLSTAAFAGTKCGPYEVAYYEYGALYYKNDADEYVGIDKDVISELSRRSGCILNGFLDSRAHIWSRLAEGRLDMTVSGIETAERRKFAIFIPYLKGRNYLITSKTGASKVTSLAAFAANPLLRLAVVRSFKHGASADAWIDKLRAEGRVDEYADANAVAMIFAKGRADAFLADPAAWGPLIRRNRLDDKVRFNDWFAGDSFSGDLVLSRQRVRPEDTAQMSETLDAMRKDGTLARIYGRYLPQHLVKRAIP